ncbi:MAG: hypothetical protein HQL87_12840 [Magnetococcales bacterium]|nr:hypothetical protein [Magnetococcales bacterium]
MVTMPTNTLQDQAACLLSAEQEAASHINHLQEEIVQLSSLSSRLEGYLCATPYRNKAANKLAGLREELRNWHIIRFQAIIQQFMNAFSPRIVVESGAAFLLLAAVLANANAYRTLCRGIDQTGAALDE